MKIKEKQKQNKPKKKLNAYKLLIPILLAVCSQPVNHLTNWKILKTCFVAHILYLMNILRIDILGPFVHEIVTKVHFGLNVLDYVAKNNQQQRIIFNVYISLSHFYL